MFHMNTIKKSQDRIHLEAIFAAWRNGGGFQLVQAIDEAMSFAAERGMDEMGFTREGEAPQVRITVSSVKDLLGTKQWRPREMADHLGVDVRSLEMFLDYYPANFARNERGWISLKAA
jgi:hypothetical protein